MLTFQLFVDTAKVDSRISVLIGKRSQGSLCVLRANKLNKLLGQARLAGASGPQTRSLAVADKAHKRPCSLIKVTALLTTCWHSRHTASLTAKRSSQPNFSSNRSAVTKRRRSGAWGLSSNQRLTKIAAPIQGRLQIHKTCFLFVARRREVRYSSVCWIADRVLPSGATKLSEMVVFAQQCLEKIGRLMLEILKRYRVGTPVFQLFDGLTDDNLVVLNKRTARPLGKGNKP